ncbi:putative late blight resistance protein homolog R1A-10 [Salvia miltiorrhiza]|uniref:putative late blight resistance protein homolog R1A-10 n=1 Tax=Salvia miltiorrhiza TaxID=226208 RepID=UPI0025AC0B69|nr:putative late blight resistance protein homolog R1A-10 [Salvia miltiorrhiza]
MAEPAVTFLLENVQKLLVDHINLISGAEAELRHLQNELELMKAFLIESANKREKGEVFRQHERQIREVVYKAEDTLDACLTQAAAEKSKSFSFKTLNHKRYDLAKKVKALREQEVQPIFDRARLGFATLPMADPATAGPERPKTEDKKVPLLREDNVVGFDGEAETVIKKLTEESAELEVISIIGMPGLGKTTLAWKIYRDPQIQYEFPTLIWVYVSQDYNIKEVFLSILKKFTQQDMSCYDQSELARKVRSYLEKPKFLLFMDDVWTDEAWNHIQAALPKSNKFGRVLITTRDEKVAWHACKREPHRLGFLELKESWELLQLEVFSRLDACPKNVELLGKHIAKQCGGVPLAIVVIGGILVEKFSSSDMKAEWEKVSASVSSHLNSDKQKRTENIILLSYNKLSYNLRDCFLYLGMFPEDSEISAWRLIHLWIAEGFIQQEFDKSLEEVAEEYLGELIARNLVMVDKTKAKGDVKTCRVHDMIREFCKSQAAFAKQNLYQEVKKTAEGTFFPPISDVPNYRRLCIHSYVVDFLRKKPKGPLVRSFVCFSKEPIIFEPDCTSLIPDAFSLLRVLDANPIKFTKFPSKITQLIHLRYIALSGDQFNSLPDAILKLWNLQTIRIDTLSRTFEIKTDIWKMLQLRHLKTKAAIVISKEARGKAGENLQTLSRLSADCCWDEVFNKASNLKNLGIRGKLSTLLQARCLAGLDRLQKLKLVYDVFPDVISHLPLRGLPSPDRFPPNLKILKLSCTFLDWKHMATLGSLPSLEVLKLKENAFMGKFWSAVGGNFPSLEVLHIARTDLEFWTASEVPSPPFPKLQCLVLRNCEKLEEIPPQLEKSLQILDIERVTRSFVQFAREMEKRKQQIPDQQRGKTGAFKLIIAPGDGR